MAIANPEKRPAAQGRVPLSALCALVFICVCFGVNWSVMKVSNQHASPMVTLFIRVLVAAICLGIWTGLVRRDNILPPSGLRFKLLLQSLLFSGHTIFAYLGVLYISAGRSSVICYLTPFFAVIFERIFLGTRPGGRQVLGMCIAFAGIILLFADRPANMPAKASWVGDVIMIVSALCWAGSSVFTKKYVAAHTRPSQTSFWGACVAMLITFIICTTTGLFDNVHLTAGYVLMLVYQGVFVAFIAFTLLQVLIYRYSAGLIHSFTFLTPLVGVLSGVLFLGEPTGSLMIICLIMVCLGLLLINTKETHHKAH